VNVRFVFSSFAVKNVAEDFTVAITLAYGVAYVTLAAGRTVVIAMAVKAATGVFVIVVGAMTVRAVNTVMTTVVFAVGFSMAMNAVTRVTRFAVSAVMVVRAVVFV
jgi:hypothetical protein